MLVTGASGFVGANLALRLLADGHEVHLLLRPEFAPWRIEAFRDRVQLHRVDLTDGAAVQSLVAKIKPAWVFHLAAYGAYSQQADASAIVGTNVLGTANLLEACLKIGFEAFVNAGSSSEYGFKDHAPTENDFLEPNSRYAVAKASATLYCRHIAQHHGAPVTTLRLYSAYGPYEEPTRLLPTLIVRGLKGELPPLVNPDIARDFVHVADVCEAFILAARSARKDGAVYNVGTGVQTSLRQVVETARRAMQLSAEPQWGSMPDRVWDSTVWVANHRKIKEELGWKPSLNFEEGFRSMLDWFRGNPETLQYYSNVLK